MLFVGRGEGAREACKGGARLRVYVCMAGKEREMLIGSFPKIGMFLSGKGRDGRLLLAALSVMLFNGIFGSVLL